MLDNTALMAALSGSAFTPQKLFSGGVQGAFFDPSDLSTMSQLSTDVVPNVAIGDPVGKMLDKSGNGNHWSQGTSAARPTLQQDASGKYYLSRDGVDDLLQTSSGALSVRRSSVLAVGLYYVAGGVNTNYNAVLSVDDGGTNFEQIGVRTSVSGAQARTRGSSLAIAQLTNPTTANNGTPAGAPIILAMKFAAATQTLSVNGVDLSPVSHTWGGSDAVTGNLNTGVAAFGVAVRIYAAFHIQRDLTDAEHASLLTWINQRTGAF